MSRKKRWFGYRFDVRVMCPVCWKGMFTPDGLVWHFIEEHRDLILERDGVYKTSYANDIVEFYFEIWLGEYEEKDD